MAPKNLEIGKQSIQYNIDSYNFLGWKDLEQRLCSAETLKTSGRLIQVVGYPEVGPEGQATI